MLQLARGLLDTDPRRRWSMDLALREAYLGEPGLRQIQTLAARALKTQPIISHLDPILEAMKKAMESLEPVLESPDDVR